MSQRFPYQRIEEDLKAQILAGQLAPGSPLPPESELAERYDVSTMTVRRALSELRALGLIVTGQGRRTTVRPKPHVRMRHTATNYRLRRATGRSNFLAEMEAQGQKAEQRLMEVTEVPAPSEIAERLDVDAGTPVIVRRRLFLVEGQPVQMYDSFYSRDLAAGTPLALPRKTPGNAHALIEDPSGPINRRIARFVEDVSARMPTEAELAALGMTPGGPVIRVIRTVYDTEGRPVEVVDSLMAADLHEFRYEIEV